MLWYTTLRGMLWKHHNTMGNQLDLLVFWSFVEIPVEQLDQNQGHKLTACYLFFHVFPISRETSLVGGLELFLFSHILEIIIPIDQYFSEGFKPPTRSTCSRKFAYKTTAQTSPSYSVKSAPHGGKPTSRSDGTAVPMSLDTKKTRWFPKTEVPLNGWFIRDNSIEMDDFGVPLFQEIPHTRIG